MEKSAFKNSNTYKDRNVETKRVWLDQPGQKLRNFILFSACIQASQAKLAQFLRFGLCMYRCFLKADFSTFKQSFNQAIYGWTPLPLKSRFPCNIFTNVLYIVHLVLVATKYFLSMRNCKPAKFHHIWWTTFKISFPH